MRVAIIGAGNVGGILGQTWITRGHDATFSIRDTEAASISDLLKRIGAQARARSVADAVRPAGVIVGATPWPATQAAIRAAGALNDKIVIDCTNPATPDSSLASETLTVSGVEHSGRSARASTRRSIKPDSISSPIGSSTVGEP